MMARWKICCWRSRTPPSSWSISLLLAVYNNRDTPRRSTSDKPHEELENEIQEMAVQNATEDKDIKRQC
jgi:hypothetical protein